MSGLFGKQGYSYQPDKEYTRFDIKNFLKQFKLNEALRIVGLLSSKLTNHRRGTISKCKYYNHFVIIDNDRYFLIDNVGINSGILAYVAMCLIENAKDNNKKLFTIPDLKQVANMYFGLPDPFFDDENAEEAMIRMGASQFEYDLDWKNFVSRSVSIYRDNWPSVPECNSIDIRSELRSLAGLSIEEIAILMHWFSTDAFIPQIESLNHPDDPRLLIFNKENINKFVEWLSIDYECFKKESEKEKQSYHGTLYKYEKYRFNPLQKFPIIKPKQKFELNGRSGYLIPSVYLLYKRATQGLFHELGNKFKIVGNTRNPFRSAFGYAFEAYIGMLLNNSNPNFKVIKPPIYGKKKQEKVVDWIVVQGNTAVLIEAKHAGINLKAKTTGELEEIKKSLKSSIAEGVEQIIKFEENIKLNKFSELSQFFGMRFQRVVVNYDPIFFTAIINKGIEEILTEKKVTIPENFSWHTVSVEQFEHIVGDKSINLYDYLLQKDSSPQYKSQDFREYLFNTQKIINNDFLAKKWLDLFSSQQLRTELEFLTGRELPDFPFKS